MEWILIVLLENGRSLESPIATTTITFNSRIACIKGGDNILSNFTTNYIKVKTYCVPKGK